MEARAAAVTGVQVRARFRLGLLPALREGKAYGAAGIVDRPGLVDAWLLVGRPRRGQSDDRVFGRVGLDHAQLSLRFVSPFPRGDDKVTHRATLPTNKAFPNRKPELPTSGGWGNGSTATLSARTLHRADPRRGRPGERDQAFVARFDERGFLDRGVDHHQEARRVGEIARPPGHRMRAGAEFERIAFAELRPVAELEFQGATWVAGAGASSLRSMQPLKLSVPCPLKTGLLAISLNEVIFQSPSRPPLIL